MIADRPLKDLPIAAAPKRSCICPTDDRFDCIDRRYGRPHGTARKEQHAGGDDGCSCACHDETDNCPDCGEDWWYCECPVDGAA
jgi:hypothetical protein